MNIARFPLELEVCNALWIGGDLGPISAACLSSFLRRGHRVVLHCYDVPKDAPQGIELSDAESVLPTSRIIRHKATGSFSLFSNLFRYELMQQSRGLWIDCDVYCVRAIVRTGDYVIGWQTPTSLNGAVLRMPSGSPALGWLKSIFAERSPLLPWLDPAEAAEFARRRKAGEDFDLGDLPWGVAGPRALTHVFRAMGLSWNARPPCVFYPVPFHRGPALLQKTDLRAFISPNTLTVHLWNEALRHFLDRRVRGSPVDRLLTEGTLFDETGLESSPQEALDAPDRADGNRHLRRRLGR